MELYRIKMYLDDIGIPRNLTGYEYLIDALSVIMDDPNILCRSGMSQIYLKMYQKNGIKFENLERNMRYAIERIFFKENAENTERLSRIFGDWYNIGHMSNMTFLMLSKRELLSGRY